MRSFVISRPGAIFVLILTLNSFTGITQGRGDEAKRMIFREI
jgi:hypothetical protein